MTNTELQMEIVDYVVSKLKGFPDIEIQDRYVSYEGVYKHFRIDLSYHGKTGDVTFFVFDNKKGDYLPPSEEAENYVEYCMDKCIYEYMKD